MSQSKVYEIEPVLSTKYEVIVSCQRIQHYTASGIRTCDLMVMRLSHESETLKN